jgi:DNA-binding NtrC family response regulator
MQKTRILFVDDEPAYRRIFRSAMRADPRLLVETAQSGDEALRKLEEFAAEIVFTDFLMPGMNGLTLLKQIHERYPGIFVLILTGVDSTREAVTAMKAGAYDYILKPFDFNLIRLQIDKIIAHKKLLRESIAPRPPGIEEYRFENIIGQDSKMFEIYEKITQVAQTGTSVLISGESGTGKELIAEAIHANSPRRDKPFVAVNCAALTEELINSELFGHERGAFTGATSQKIGFFEEADGGTIFLDEIGDIPAKTQVALLRVLELGSFHRVGGSRPLKVDVRLICATNKDLSHAIREKYFREDLYYRINVVSITAPALRDRRSDIPLLARYFLEKYGAAAGKKISGISSAAMDLLMAYRWPGNVRELANVIEHAVVFCRESELKPAHLPSDFCGAPPAPHTELEVFSLSLPSHSLAQAEAILIRKVLEEKEWNLSQAAEELDIARGTLYSKMQKYGIAKS